MARVWRDGQLRPVTVYRLATTGTLEEKIFQRQITKQGLGGGFLDEDKGSVGGKKFHFTKEELRDIFSLNADTSCDTHDLLGCPCGGVGSVEGQGAAKSAGDGDDVRLCQLGDDLPSTAAQGAKGKESASPSVGIKDLLGWAHIDPAREELDDPCLKGASEVISFVFKTVHGS